MEAEQYFDDTLDLVLLTIYGNAWSAPKVINHGDDVAIEIDGTFRTLFKTDWVVIDSGGRMQIVDNKSFRNSHVPLSEVYGD